MKKIVYPILFCILTSVIGGALVTHPNILFLFKENMFWNILRSILMGGMVSLILCSLLYIILNKHMLSCYFLKLWKYRTLLYLLVRRDFLAKYKRSVLGVLWSLLNPLMTMAVMTIVFSYMFRFNIENFPVYMLSGQIVFTMFSEITNLSMTSVMGAAALIKKVNTPKYFFALSKAISGLINFAFSFVALLLVMLVTGAPFYPQMLFSVISVVYVFLFSTGVGLILSALSVFFRDITYIYGIGLTAVTYFTPLFYPIDIIPDKFRWIISINPLYHFVECFRTCTIYGDIPSLWQNVICLTLSLSMFGIGLFVFYRKQDQFILYI